MVDLWSSDYVLLLKMVERTKLASIDIFYKGLMDKVAELMLTVDQLHMEQTSDYQLVLHVTNVYSNGIIEPLSTGDSVQMVAKVRTTSYKCKFIEF